MEFYASLYQFTLKCWDDESLVCPWITHPLPEIYDPAGGGTEMFVNLYDLYVSVLQNGGWDKMNRWNYKQWRAWSKPFNVSHSYLILMWERHLQCYAAYGDMVKAYFWGCEISDHPEVYEAEVEALRESIRKSTEERADALIFRDKAVHLEKNPKPRPLGTLFLDKEELIPEDSVSEVGSGSFGLPKYAPSDHFHSLFHQAESVTARYYQTTVVSMDGEVRYTRKWTPPPHPIMHQDETGRFDNFRGTARNGFDDDWLPDNCGWASRKDREELLTKYGLTVHEEEGFGPRLERKIYFDDWILENGVARAKDVWREWMRADPGLRVTD
jgi:hypothetical protein